MFCCCCCCCCCCRFKVYWYTSTTLPLSPSLLTEVVATLEYLQMLVCRSCFLLIWPYTCCKCDFCNSTLQFHNRHRYCTGKQITRLLCETIINNYSSTLPFSLGTFISFESGCGWRKSASNYD